MFLAGRSIELVGIVPSLSILQIYCWCKSQSGPGVAHYNYFYLFHLVWIWTNSVLPLSSVTVYFLWRTSAKIQLHVCRVKWAWTTWWHMRGNRMACTTLPERGAIMNAHCQVYSIFSVSFSFECVICSSILNMIFIFQFHLFVRTLLTMLLLLF